MSDAVTIQADPAAQAKLTTLLTRLQAEAHKGAEEATRWAAFYALQSLRPSTRKAPARLRLVSNPGNDTRHQRPAWRGYVVKYGSKGDQRREWIRADENPEPKLRNPRAGLAQQSWRWAIADLGLGSGSSALKRPQNAIAATSRGGMTPTVTVANRLRYIVSAMREGGKRGVDTALARGATAGLRYLDRRIAKGMAR